MPMSFEGQRQKISSTEKDTERAVEEQQLLNSLIRGNFPADIVIEMDHWSRTGSGVDEQKYYAQAERFGFNWDRVRINAMDVTNFRGKKPVTVSAKQRETIIRGLWKDLMRGLLVNYGLDSEPRLVVESEHTYIEWKMKVSTYQRHPIEQSIEYTIVGDMRLLLSAEEGESLQTHLQENNAAYTKLKEDIIARARKLKDDADQLVNQFNLQRVVRVY